MRRTVFRGYIAFLLLAGPFPGARPSSGAASDSLTPSQCVRSMTDLEKEITALSARIAACRTNDSLEPNDTPETATPLISGVEVLATVGQDNPDVFAIEAPAGKTVVFSWDYALTAGIE